MPIICLVLLPMIALDLWIRGSLEAGDAKGFGIIAIANLAALGLRIGYGWLHPYRQTPKTEQDEILTREARQGD